jgi:hypothetical protein
MIHARLREASTASARYVTAGMIRSRDGSAADPLLVLQS